MRFQVGDVVWVTVSDSLGSGAKRGSIGTILKLDNGDAKVDFGFAGWWISLSHLAVVNAAHIPDDLAMALELANRIQRETWFANEHQGDTISPEADWLRAEVIAALRGAR